MKEQDAVIGSGKYEDIFSLYEPGESRVIFDRQWNQRKIQNRLDNIAHFTGFREGTYYRNGVGQPHKGKKLDR